MFSTELINKTYGHKSWQWKRQNSWRIGTWFQMTFRLSCFLRAALERAHIMAAIFAKSIIKMPNFLWSFLLGKLTKPFLRCLRGRENPRMDIGMRLRQFFMRNDLRVDEATLIDDQTLASAGALIILSGVSIAALSFRHRLPAQKLSAASSSLSHRLKKRVAKILLMSLYCYVFWLCMKCPVLSLLVPLTCEEASLKN